MCDYLYLTYYIFLIRCIPETYKKYNYKKGCIPLDDFDQDQWSKTETTASLSRVDSAVDPIDLGSLILIQIIPRKVP